MAKAKFDWAAVILNYIKSLQHFQVYFMLYTPY